MTKNGNTAQKSAAREVQRALGIPYTQALQWVTEVKLSRGILWSEAAQTIIKGEA